MWNGDRMRWYEAEVECPEQSLKCWKWRSSIRWEERALLNIHRGTENEVD